METKRSRVAMRSFVSSMLALAVAGLAAGCASGKKGSVDAADHTWRPDAGWLDGSQGDPDGAVDPDGSAGLDGSILPDGTIQPDAASQSDGAVLHDAASQPDAAVQPDGGGGPLDPDLELPDPGGQVCQTPGSMTECPSLQVCRFYDSVEGRCEGCLPCGNLNDSCTASNQCDILFTCYQNHCTNICPLGSFECGPIDDCLDIGHPSYGVCRPF